VAHRQGPAVGRRCMTHESRTTSTPRVSACLYSSTRVSQPVRSAGLAMRLWQPPRWPLRLRASACDLSLHVTDPNPGEELIAAACHVRITRRRQGAEAVTLLAACCLRAECHSRAKRGPGDAPCRSHRGRLCVFAPLRAIPLRASPATAPVGREYDRPLLPSWLLDGASSRRSLLRGLHRCLRHSPRL
jgi:hypothetical protein